MFKSILVYYHHESALVEGETGEQRESVCLQLFCVRDPTNACKCECTASN